jgi:hypothetical protein
MRASRNFQNVRTLPSNQTKRAVVSVGTTSRVEPVAEHATATASAPTPLTRDDLSAASTPIVSPKVPTPTAKIELYTAAQLAAGRKLTNSSTPEECKSRFDLESRLLEERVRGVINNPSNSFHGSSYRVINVNGILSTINFNKDENHKHALIWPYETQGPNAYTPEFSLHEDKAHKVAMIIDAPKNGDHLSYRHEIVDERMAECYNREFNPTTPINTGETVIRVLKQRADRSYREEILTESLYSAREGSAV